MDSSVLKWLGSRKMSLENIFLNHKTTDEELTNYGAVFQKTKICILGGNCNRSACVTHQGLAFFVDNCSQLECLSLSYCQNLKSGESIAYLSSHCEKLHSLVLMGCNWVRNIDIEISRN